MSPILNDFQMKTGISRREAASTISTTRRCHLLIWGFKLSTKYKKLAFFMAFKSISKDKTYTVEILNGMHAASFPSCFWPYSKLCLFKVNRKGTTWTSLRCGKAITSRTKRLMPSTARPCKCEIIDYHLK